MTLQFKIIAALIVAVIVTLVATLGGQQVLAWKHGAEQNVQRGQTLTTASGIVHDGEKADASTKQAEAGVTQGQGQYRIIIEEGRHNDPTAADRADRPVPDSVRRAYHARRIARERPGRDGSEREEDPGAADAAQR